MCAAHSFSVRAVVYENKNTNIPEFSQMIDSEISEREPEPEPEMIESEILESCEARNEYDCS